MNLLIGAILVFIINLPFGYWRAQHKKLSFWWFFYIHIPIPFVILIRYILDIGFELYSYPIFITAYFSSQYLAGLFNKK